MQSRDAVEQAIAGRWCLAVTYRHYSRVIAPLAIGTGSGGATVVLAYQVGGGDHEGCPLGWKLFELDGLCGPRILPEHAASPAPPPPNLLSEFQTRPAAGAFAGEARSSG